MAKYERKDFIFDCEQMLNILRHQLKRRENGIDGDGEVWELGQIIEEIEDWVRRARSNELPPQDDRCARFCYLVTDTWSLNSDLGSKLCGLADKYRRRLP